MAYKAPIFDVTLGTEGFKSKIEAHMLDVRDEFTKIANELPLIQPTAFAANLSAIEPLLMPNGVVGTDSFDIIFTEESTVDVVHLLPSSGTNTKSACVINNRYHETTEEFSGQLSNIVPNIDGDYVLNFGAKSNGAPSMKILLEVDSTDNDQTITFWQFDVNRAGAVLTVTNRRRIAPVLISREAFTNVHDFEHPLTYYYKGLLPVLGGPLETGIIVPWDCEVVGGHARLENGPVAHTMQEDVTIDFVTGSGTDSETVFANAASWSPGQDGVVKTLNALSQPKQLTAGSYIFPEILIGEVETTDLEATSSDLSAVIRLQRIYHEIK